jgi:hypothetical protein
MKEEKTEKNENKFQISPDKTTYVWKQNFYRLDNPNKKVCIYQGNNGYSEWLCSA